ncbi:hypothetical protein Acr_25g0007630 [Actinidia rufa]|uniref:Uncharacterized protein n=1 Tax=Actinidia rufa TaxID=165716 RepID=A0A7J0H0P8_9ERIC|nr:hypothetical protein Acr_25g0007630 [Actinidia rufa]
MRITPQKKPRMRNEMNKKMIGHIRQCIGHEWTKLKEMYREKSSQNKALVRRLVLKLQRGTTVAEQTSEFQRATGRGQKEEAREEVLRKRSQRRDKKNCPRNKAQDQSLEAATTAMMAVDESDVLLAASADEESDWISDSGIAYHLCRDKEVFSTHVACEGLVRMANDAIVGKTKDSPVPHGRREIHEGDRGKQEKLQEKEDWKAIPTEGECPDRRAAVRHRSSGISKMNGRRKQQVHTGTQSKRSRDVHEEAQRRETESMHNDRRDVAETSLFRSRYVMVISLVVHTREERWNHDDLHTTYFAAHPGEGESRPPKSYRRAGPEVVGMDNLKNSEYPPMGWRGEIVGMQPNEEIEAQPMKPKTKPNSQEKAQAQIKPKPKPNMNNDMNCNSYWAETKGRKEERKKRRKEERDALTALSEIAAAAAKKSKMEATSLPRSLKWWACMSSWLSSSSLL